MKNCKHEFDRVGRRCIKCDRHIYDGLSDAQILQSQYEKYNDKTGTKAQNLKTRIEAFKAFEKLVERVKQQK